MSELENGFRLSEVVELLRRRKWIVLVAAVVGAAIGVVAFSSTPSRFSATARVQVQPITADPFAIEAPETKVIDVATEQDLVKSDSVAETVLKRLDLDLAPRELLQRATVTSKEDSLVMEITYEAGSAGAAQDGANAFADAYLNVRREDAAATKQKNLDQIETQRDFTRESIDTARVNGDDDAVDEYQSSLIDLNQKYLTYSNINTDAAGRVVRRAPLPAAVMSKMALAKGIGIFGIFVVLGALVGLVVDRRDSLGGGRRRVGQILPEANIRIMPGVASRSASPTEIDAAIDRLAIELSSGAVRGRSTSVLLVSSQDEPPVALAEDLASSLSFAGIPALFVLAGTSRQDLPQAQVVTSFTDLISGSSLSGPLALPEDVEDRSVATTPLVTWLRPRGSAEASGLLRRAVVQALLARAGREGFEVVFFVASTPTHSAAATALGQWVEKTAIVILDDDSQSVEQTASAMDEAGAHVTEVVWA